MSLVVVLFKIFWDFFPSVLIWGAVVDFYQSTLVFNYDAAFDLRDTIYIDYGQFVIYCAHMMKENIF